MNDIDRSVKKFSFAFIVVWVIGFLISIGVIGVGVWALVRVILHFT